MSAADIYRAQGATILEGLFQPEDFRRGCRLGERDHLVVLEKPKVRPAWMTAEQYAEVPATLTVRELRVGGKTLVTTLLSAKQVPKNELKSLYRQRWHVELDFRCLKTTMGMEMLSCKSPAMAIKVIWVYLLAYNVIRRMMLQAACMEDLLPRQLSFSMHCSYAWPIATTWRIPIRRPCKPCCVSSPDAASGNDPGALNRAWSNGDRKRFRY